MTKRAWFTLCVLLLGVPRPALADDLDEFERLTEHGHEQFSAGDYAGALSTFERAAAHHSGCPTATLWAGKSLEQLGLLGAALDVYNGITALQLPSDATKACRDAQLEASARQADVNARVGHLELTVQGAGGDLRVSIAGRPRALLPSHRGPANPGPGTAASTWQLPLEAGEFQIEVRSAGGSRRGTVHIGAGKTSSLLIDFTPKPTPPTAAEPAAAVVPSSPVAMPAEVAPGWSQSSWGWVAIGVGAAGIATGAVTGVLVLGDVEEVEAECSRSLRLCSDRGLKTQGQASGLATLSSVAWGVGVLGVAGGLVLLLTDDATAAPEQDASSAWQPRARVSGEGAWLGVDGSW